MRAPPPVYAAALRSRRRWRTLRALHHDLSCSRCPKRSTRSAQQHQIVQKTDDLILTALSPIRCLARRSMATSTVDGNKAPELFALLCSSLVVLGVALVGADSNPTYVLIFGVGSTAVSLLMLVVQVMNSELLDRRLCTLPKAGDVNTGLLLALFLFGWWAVGGR